LKLNIDTLSDSTGWTVNSPSTISEITRSSLIAGLNTKSLLIIFDKDDGTRTATKTFATPFDVTNYDTLVFSIWSQLKGSNDNYLKAADFSYKICLDGSTE